MRGFEPRSLQPHQYQRNIKTTFGLQFGVYLERMKETHAITTTHDVPADIREALKIREDLDGISGEIFGYAKATTGHLVLRSFMVACVFVFWASVGSWMWGGGLWGLAPNLSKCVGITLFFCVGPSLFVLVESVRFESPSFSERVKLPVGFNKYVWSSVPLSFAFGHTKFLWQNSYNSTGMNHQIGYTEVQNISVVKDGFELGIRIHVAGKRAPVKVVLDYRMKREAEWLVEQIQARMAATQSGTVPEDLTRLTKQAGEAESSSRPANASATTQTT